MRKRGKELAGKGETGTYRPAEINGGVFLGMGWLTVAEVGSVRWGGCFIRLLVGSQYSTGVAVPWKTLRAVSSSLIKEEPSNEPRGSCAK